MPTFNKLDVSDSASIARFLCEASEPEFLYTFHEMRARRELTPMVHSLGLLLSDAVHGANARAALHRLGLDQGG